MEFSKSKYRKESSPHVSCLLSIYFKRDSLLQTWLVGDELSEDEQLKAPKGTLFIPFSQFPPRKARKD